MTDIKVMKDTINAKIDMVGHSERITKQNLSELSRECIDYVLLQETFDIAVVNRLLSHLTPINKEHAKLFFAEFLPWKQDESGMFTSMKKGDRLRATAMIEAADWLAVESNDIWQWVKENVKAPEKKAVDYAGRVTKAVEQALDKGHMSKLDVMRAMVQGGITARDIIDIVEEFTKDEPVKQIELQAA